MAQDFARMLRVRIRLRDARADLKRQFEEADKALKEKEERIDGHLLAHLNATGSDSVKTPEGTFFRQEEITAAAADWDAVYAFIEANNAWEMLERRIKKTFVVQHMEDHEGTPPPGVSVFRKYAVRVRRA